MAVGRSTLVASIDIFLLFVVGIGAAFVPDMFLSLSRMAEGDESVTARRRFQMRLVGVAFTAAAVYMLYSFVSSR